MKKIFLLALILIPFAMKAQMEYVPGSFVSNNAGAKVASGNDMGVGNVTGLSIDWPLDVDGNDNAALLIVYFDNFPPEEIKNVTPSLSYGAMIIGAKKESIDDKGNHFMMIYVPAKQNMDVSLTHPKYGEARFNANFTKHNVYEARVRNKANVKITVQSNPSGAEVLLDNKVVGHTPLEINEVTLGAHLIELRSPDPVIANGLSQTTIEVSESHNLFQYDLRKRIKAVFHADPHDAALTLYQNGKVISKSSNGILTATIPVGEYVINGIIGTVDVSQAVSITPESRFPMTVEVIPTKTITFKAIRNNMAVEGAAININGKTYGETPKDIPLKYGSYEVQMVYSGVSRQGKIKVNDKTSPTYELVLPARQSGTHNPFHTYYRKRAWGLNVAYVNKWYSLKVNNTSKKYDIWDQEKTMTGIQAGITYQPYFGYGQGLNTGIYWQGFFGTVDFQDGDVGHYEEHNLYVPLQYQFRLPLGENFSVALNAGVALTYGVSNSVKIGEERYDVGFGHNDEYNTYMPKRLQFSVPLGVALQYKAMQLEFKYSLGLTDNEELYNSTEHDKISYKSGFWSGGISFLF